MSDIDQLINRLVEGDEDEDFDLKDITLPDEELVAGPSTVKRHGRIKIVDMPLYTFLISYLTPVAYYDKTFKIFYETMKQWSPTTNRHIQQWSRMIADSPEWKNDERNWEPSSWNPEGHYVRHPRFKKVRQSKISGLFRKLINTMEMKPHEKRRMYHVDPRMRQGSDSIATWASGHLKHHDTGEEGLPRPDDPGYSKFFTDFEPPEPEYFDWSDSMSRRDTTPYERGTPDEE